MARAGMLHRGGKNGADGGDDVQRSLELLDKVLSEFDEGEPRSLDSQAPLDSHAPHTPHTPATPDDDSPSLTGHQSEDDGYMSMNGRRAKFALGFRPTEEREESDKSDNKSGDTPLSPPRTALPAPPSPHSPPPPEEAQRIISTLLPKVSPANSAKRTVSKIEEQRHLENEKFDSLITSNGITTATQTTLPKTRHQRPYGWEKGPVTPAFQLQQPPVPPCRFASLPYGNRPPSQDGFPPNWLPPRHQINIDSNNSLNKRSPSLENQPVFPFMVLSAEKPYNEHPVTIYPGPTKQFNKVHSPTFAIQRVPPYNPKSHQTPENKKVVKPDDRIEAAFSPGRKIPPRTLAGSMERHREVCRSSLEDIIGDCTKRSSKNNEEDHFSDDSLEECFPPPPPAVSTPSKRNSIAWEVSLDIDDPLLTPGSTKVIGRRRRKSGDNNSHSSTSSIPQRIDDCDWTTEDFWPPPPVHCSTEDELASPFSDTESDPAHIPSDINTTGTYVIRKGKNRKQLPAFAKSANKPTKNDLTQSLNRSLDMDKSTGGSSVSISGMSGSHNSVSSYGSRPSSDLSIPQSRYSVDINSRLSRELNTPNSRYSIDLCTPNSRIIKEIASPKSRLSLDLNNGQDRHLALEFLNHSPRNYKSEKNNPYVTKNAHVPNKLSPQNRFTDFKKYSSTFDNIKSLMKEGKIENCEPPNFDETVIELSAVAPNMVRVVSLPSLANENESSSNSTSRQALITTVEEEEDQEIVEPNSEEASPLRKIENNINAILCQGRDQKQFTPYMPKDWNIHKDEYCDDPTNILEKNLRYSSRERQKRQDIQKSSSHNEIQCQRSIDRRDRSSGRRSSSMHKSTSAKEYLMRQPSSSDSAVSSSGDFPLNVQIVEHSYRNHPLPASPSMGLELGPLPQTPESPKLPPLPPSPVQEVEDEYSEILQPRHSSKSDTLPIPNMDLRHRCSEPPAVPPHRDSTGSLKTRSMEAGYSKNKRSNFKSGSTDRRTLPTDMAASGVRRRTLQRQNREATPPGARQTPLQTSASLPETPIFARGCDVPRTPLRQTSTGLGPRQSNTMNSIQTISGSSTLGGYGRGSVVGAGTGVERALAGAELLRLAGGPARGWYPRQRHRPASIEHLDRLTVSGKSSSEHHAAWDGTASRKPLTLPPNLTPKFFQKSPREALRRVTSLLIRKGNNGKEKEPARGKEATSPAARSANAGDDHPGQKQRKGFFKSFWKRSRHYSLEQP